MKKLLCILSVLVPFMTTPVKAEEANNKILVAYFSATGTTAVVAKKLGRNYIGMDLNLDYVALASKRLTEIENETNKPTQQYLKKLKKHMEK